MVLSAIGCVLGLSVVALAHSQSTVVVVPVGATPSFRVVEISRTIQAVNYRHRSGVTGIDFAGSALMPAANGRAKVRSKRGTMEVEAEFGSLQSPTTFGGEYLTYVLWAITPEGHASNLGELLIGDNNRSKLTATTDQQSFALIVTAEPYFAVRQPSNIVVLENVVRADTKGTSERVDAKYELMERGGYLPTGYQFDPVVLNANLPLAFYEARNALRIAKSENADVYAIDNYQHAVQLMKGADEDAIAGHVDKKVLIAAARDTVETAEDAREIAVKRMEEMYLAADRQTLLDGQRSSQNQADAAIRLKEQAQADAARAQADMAANKTASDAAIGSAQADANQSRLLAQQAQQSAQQANSDKETMRAELAAKLNLILETRDSARGLIVSMSDVLFDTGKYSLKSGAREKLAKVAGILISYPGLYIAVGGYTDNVGGDTMNQTLSVNRAGSVRGYLVEQGVSENSVTAQGFGNTLPVASNENAAGRQQNRRVELLVSGDAIGIPVNTTVGSLN